MSDEKLKKRNENNKDSKASSSEENDNENDDKIKNNIKKEENEKNENENDISRKSSSNLSASEEPSSEGNVGNLVHLTESKYNFSQGSAQNTKQPLEFEIPPEKDIDLAEQKEDKSREDIEPTKSIIPSKSSAHMVFVPLKDMEKPSKSSKDNIKRSSSFYTTLTSGDAFVYMVLPPDGGYGWFLVFISFLVQLIVDGIVFSIGITLPFIANDLNVGQAQIIFVSALQVSFYYLSGPISSAIINTYGFRKVAISGSLGAIVCLIIASFSPNLEMLLIFYSCLAGPLLSMVWVSSQLIVGYYFEKYRSIANGLSCSGSGVGFFTFANMNSILVPKIGWRHNMQIHAIFVCVVVLLSIAFIEVSPTKIGIIRERKIVDDSNSSNEEVEISTFAYGDVVVIQSEHHFYVQREYVPINERRLFKCQKYKRSKCCFCCKKTIDEVRQSEESEVTKRYVIQNDLFDKQDLFYTGEPEYVEDGKPKPREIISGVNMELIKDEKTVAAVQYTLSVSNVPKAPSVQIKEKRCCGCVKLSKKFPKKIKNAFLLLFNFQLFRVLEFRILFFSALCFSLGMNIPFLFSKARSALPSNETNLLPWIIGVSNCVSRIVSGFTAFTLRRYVVHLCGGAITLGGFFVLLSAFLGADDFWFQMMYAILFGTATGFFSALRAVTYVKYLGLKNLTNAFGLIAMGMGTGIFAGTVISGYLIAISGSYMISFIFSGSFILTSGLLKLLLPIIIYKMQQNRNPK